MAGIGVAERGGHVDVIGKDGKAGLSVNEYGGRVDVSGKRRGKVAMGITEYGNGIVNTWDKNGYRQ